MKKLFKKIITSVIVSVVAISVFLYFRLPDNWKEIILFPICFPNVSTTAVTNNKQTNLFSEKIWIHRVNSIERMKIMEEKYKGIEMDIRWDEDSSSFYVSHDPDKEIYLHLYQLLDSVKNIQEHYFWFDFKNLNEDNSMAALNCLLKLASKHNLNRENIIIESGKPVLLVDFTQAGFSTSYYLPTFNPYTVSKDEIINYAQIIDATLLKSNVNYISYDFIMHRFVKKYFHDSQMLMWHIDENKYTPYLRKMFVEDVNVKVVLISCISDGYR